MSEIAEAPGLLDRAVRRVTGLWRDVADRVVGTEVETIADRMRACLAARGGEVSARNRAASLAQAYQISGPAGRREFLDGLAGLDANPKLVDDAILRLGAAAPEELAAARLRLRRAMEPPRIKLLTQLTTIPDGVKFLVDLRAELLQQATTDPTLEPLEADLKGLLANWFDVGFLELRRIDWSSPAALLEKLVEYEVVHRIRTWRDLKNRLDSDRRCYAFFHPRMPAEPLIFVEVALVKGLSDSVQRLLDAKAPLLDPKQADTAIFYSINNCQRGLDGISFGNFLIKRVAELLSEELHNLKTFATLSPMPGFCGWLRETGAGLVTEEEAATLRAACPAALALAGPETPASPTAAEQPAQTFARVLARRGWLREEAVVKALEPVLIRLGAYYLVQEGSRRDPKRARDPVAHFHLSNGARIERLNWRADVSDKGLRESAGLMVNYLYALDRIEENHEGYVGDGKRATATALRRLARS